MPTKRTSKRKSKTGRPTKAGRPKKAARRGTGAAGPLRLQRLLASAGYGSRRQCEELIEAGRVEVDGEIVTRLGTTVDPQVAKVRVDGDLLKERKLVYYAVHKPIGVVTTNRDPQGRPRVIDLVPPDERVFPVGRLDRNSEGLILLTNDGDLAQKLTHPKFGVRKVYRVTVAGKVDLETLKQMRRGIYIAEGHVRVEGAKLLKTRSRSTEMEIVLREGKNREIRRILARLGHKVQHLRRIAVGPLRLGDLPAGAYRVVKRNEVDKLWQVAESEETDSHPKGRKRGSKKRGTQSKPSANRRSSPKKKSDTRGKRQASRPSELPGISSDTTVGSVIGGDPSEPFAAEQTDTPPRRGRKTVKPKSRGTTSRSKSRGKTSRGKKLSGAKSRSPSSRSSKSSGSQATRGSKSRGSKSRGAKSGAAKSNSSRTSRGSSRKSVKPKNSRGKQSASKQRARRKRN